MHGLTSITTLRSTIYSFVLVSAQTPTVQCNLLRLLPPRLPGGRLLGHLLTACNGSLDANAAKDETHAQPLHLREAVPESHDGEDHGEHLAGHGHGHEEHRGEGGEGVDLAVVEC